MKIGRRALLIGGGTGVVASLAAGGALVWRKPVRPGGNLLLGGPGSPSSTRGVVCVGNAAPDKTRVPLHPDALARFVDRLPIPPVHAPIETRPDPNGHGLIDVYRVAMRQTETRIHRDVPPTSMWSYDGHVPGPTFETRRGRGILVEWTNDLPAAHFLPIDHTLCGKRNEGDPDVRAVVHVHGAKAPPESDGHPDDWLAPGKTATHHYPNDQDAATLWYHDHAMGLERLNQYAGLYGLFLIRDDAEDALDLPKGDDEIPLVLCDRLFDADGKLHYPTSGSPEMPWISELRGDALLVNGTLFPYLDVEPRAYRFRIVNAANSRFYDLTFSNDRPFHQIGSDQGLLAAPVPLTKLTLAPGERADIVIDFRAAAGDTILFRTGFSDMMQIRVGARSKAAKLPARALPKTLRSIRRITESEAVVTRHLTLDEYDDPKTMRMLMLLDGKYWRDAVTEKPKLGTTEIWNLMNLTEDTHPIHLHLVRFQILDRQVFDADEYQTSGKLRLIGKRSLPEPGEDGWKDTVRAHPGSITRIAARFEGYAGRYVWHCHVLEHAANEMMRPFEVIA